MYILENLPTFPQYPFVTGHRNHNLLVREARRQAFGEIKRGQDGAHGRKPSNTIDSCTKLLARDGSKVNDVPNKS